MMEYEKRAMIETEDKYTFRQSEQLSMQCGLIGYLRADMDTDGNGFFSTWNDWRKELKTQEFKDEFDAVINSLREEGDILHNRKSIAEYCYSNPQAKMTGEQDYYGVRVDSEKYAYLLRLNPNKGEYNLYCYCYRRDWLDAHLKKAMQGIRFITPDYQEKFRIADGEQIRIRYPDGEIREPYCRYIDEYHVEVGDDLFHICELAEKLENSGAEIIPLRSSLPKQCYSILAETGEIIILKRGESGYYKTDIPSASAEDSRALVDEYNRKLGVSKAQEYAMKAGSMFGFQVPAADPKNYGMDGKLKKEPCKERGEAR